MIVLGYIGNHKKDDILVRLGWFITRLMQTGKFKRVTHTECVHAGSNYKLCTIASSSARDHGVRSKENIALTKGNWIALDVPSWAIEPSKAWFKAFDGCPYDWLGAAGTKLHFLRNLHYSVERFFCNETTPKALPVSYMANPQELTPSEFFEVLERDFGAVDVTDLFFKD
jgi:hypothetical protein